MAIITAPEELASLRQSGKIAARALQAAAAAVREGVTTAELNVIAEAVITASGATPSFRGFEDYPAGLCTSINDEVVHGIPSSTRTLRTGDIIGLDIGVNYHGLFTDHALTIPVGATSDENLRLIKDTEDALRAGIRIIRSGRRIGDISNAVEQYLRPRGYGIVTQLTGHGLGYSVHDTPMIPNVGRPNTGPVLQVGMVLAIEPMVTLGTPTVETLDDGWTVVTADHRYAAHAEHTIVVTTESCELMTIV